MPHVTRIEMHTFAWEPFCAVFRELIATGLVKELHTYDGCGNLRKKRGINEWSIHSWYLALDFDQALEPLNGAHPLFASLSQRLAPAPLGLRR